MPGKKLVLRIIMKVMIKCDEAANVCDKAQYKEASAWEKLTMKFHHLMCRICRQHSLQNTKLTQLLKKSKVRTLNKAQKEAIKERLRKEMSN
jgi:DNA-binding GntR family transcriptional regulator